jgi:cytochrome oxidase assembly protein ShyY1
VRAPLLRVKYWPGHLAMLVCVAIAVGLGVWQLDAWHQHRAAAARNLVDKPAVPLAELMTGDSAFPGREVGRPVTFSGSWLGDATVYVADRELDGRRGYWVVTPVVVGGAGTGSAMPVVRGWSAEPSAPDPSGSVQVTGWLQPSEGSGNVDDDPHDRIIPMMRVASLVEHVDADLYSGYVVARRVSTGSTSAGATTGLKPVPAPSGPGVSTFTGVRNLFYAVEWWLFGSFAVFLWVRWCRDSLAPSDATDLEATPA